MQYVGMLYTNALEHHGILGMHWGSRNGPPYPLRTGDHSASEKKAGWKKSLSTGKSYIKKKKQDHDAKKASKIARKMEKKSVGKTYIKNMSDDDLRRATTRLRLEADYMKALAESQRYNKTRKDKFKEAAANAGINLVKAGGKVAADELTKKLKNQLDPMGAEHNRNKKKHDYVKQKLDLAKRTWEYNEWLDADEAKRAEILKRKSNNNNGGNK